MSTTWADKQTATFNAPLRCTLQDVGPDRLTVRRNSVASHAAPPVGGGGSAKLGCRVLRRHRGILVHALARCLHPCGDREAGLVWEAPRVISGDRRAQQTWQEDFKTHASASSVLSRALLTPCRRRARSWATARFEPRGVGHRNHGGQQGTWPTDGRTGSSNLGRKCRTNSMWLDCQT